MTGGEETYGLTKRPILQTMQGELLVSTIIPVYNGERYLADAIESVLAQRHRPIEIAVVDDGSTDGTAEIAKRFKGSIRYTYQPNRGVATARNEGLKVAKGDVIGFLDADDLWPEGKLEVQLGYLVDNPSTEVVIGQVQFSRVSGGEAGAPVFSTYAEPFVSTNLGSALFRRSAFDRIGLFDEGMAYNEDTDWFMRARECSVSMVVLDEVALIYRIHQQNMIRFKSERDRYFARALKMSLDRRRKAGQDAATDLPPLSRPSRAGDG